MSKSIKYLNLLIPLILLSILFSSLSCGRTSTSKEEAETVDTLRRITMIFGGDIMQHMPQIEAARNDSTYNFDDSFKYLKPLFDSTDLVVLNFETTISPDQRFTGYPMFASPPAIMSSLKDNGVDAVMLANNHICDRGKAGIISTVKEAGIVGLKHTGAFLDSVDYLINNPLVVEVNKFNLAFLNYTYSTNGLPVPKGTIVNMIDTTQIKKDLHRLRSKKIDYTIVFFHWGEEYSRTPSSYQRKLAEWCYQQGVDFVIGSHPHVLMPVESRADSCGNIERLTAYSLGNLISNQRWRHSDGGMLLKVEIVENSNTTLPNNIEASYLLAWVHTPIIKGKRRYEILPSSVADTLLDEGTVAKQEYELFMTDSRKLLGSDSNIYELN